MNFHYGAFCCITEIKIVFSNSWDSKDQKTKDPRFNGMALICNALCFHKTEIDRFFTKFRGCFPHTARKIDVYVTLSRK